MEHTAIFLVLGIVTFILVILIVVFSMIIIALMHSLDEQAIMISDLTDQLAIFNKNKEQKE